MKQVKYQFLRINFFTRDRTSNTYPHMILVDVLFTCKISDFNRDNSEAPSLDNYVDGKVRMCGTQLATLVMFYAGAQTVHTNIGASSCLFLHHMSTWSRVFFFPGRLSSPSLDRSSSEAHHNCASFQSGAAIFWTINSLHSQSRCSRDFKIYIKAIVCVCVKVRT